MKLTFSTLACPAWTLEQILDAAEQNKIEGIDFRGIGKEIDITKLPAFTTELGYTLSELKRRNIEMPCLNTSVTLVTPAPERWQMMLEECQRYAQLAARTKTPHLRVFGGNVPKEMSRDEARSLAQRHLRQLVKICKPHNTQIIFETHDAWSIASEVLEIVGDFSPDEAAVLWDTEHSYHKGESLRDTAQALKDRIRHLHVKDSKPEGDHARPTLLGEGTFPMKECLKALREIGFKGWTSLETEKRWDESAPDPEQSIPQFATYMRKMWDEVPA
jgi:sugar phosphate isomerase/epimerase